MRNAPWSKAGPDFVKGRCANSGWLGLEHWSPVPNFLKLEDLGAIFERPGCDFRKAFSASHALLLSARGLARGIKLKMKPVWSVERSMACGRACGGRGRSVLKQQETRHDPAWPGKIHHSLWQEPTRYTSPLHPALLVVVGLMSSVPPAGNKHGVNVHLLSHHLISSLNDVAPCVTAVRTRDRQMSLRVPNHVRQC